jgi:asparagine synthase (glutamine-hydrolysing)
MSGIYGIFRYDGKPVDPTWTGHMRVAMREYGPDGSGEIVEDSVAMGHLLLITNPEDAYEKQPMRSSRAMLVTAARLDNRSELQRELELTTSEMDSLSDGYLVNLAYQRWGTEVSKYLEGDWALAAWNPHEHRLFLSRDACGNSSLYFYQGQGYFAFASSIKALLAIPGVELQPDLTRMVQVLVSWQIDAERTGYEGFRRLLWSHAMMVDDRGQTKTWKHWTHEGRPLIRYKRDEEYVVHYLALYERAVKSALRTQKPVAATLSAGRDSGSVVALAAPHLAAQGRELTAYTAVPLYAPDGAEGRHLGNEWELAHQTAVMAGPNVRHVAIDAAGYSVLGEIQNYVKIHRDAGHAMSNQYWMRAIRDRAIQDGHGVLLGGYLGNACVSWEGTGSALRALMDHGIRDAWDIFRNAEENFGLSLRRQIVGPLLWTPRRLWQQRKQRWQKTGRSNALSAEMARKLKIDRFLKETGQEETFRPAPWKSRQDFFFSSSWCIGASLNAEQALTQGLTSIDPTFQRSLVEFVLSVPDIQFRRKGRKSDLIRRAMAGRMPEDVLNGSQKGLQAADLGYRMRDEAAEVNRQIDLLMQHPIACELLDLSRMREVAQKNQATVNRNTYAEMQIVTARGLGVGYFLQQCREGSGKYASQAEELCMMQ